MRVTFLWVGRTKDAHLSRLIEKYRKAIGRFMDVAVVSVRAESGGTPEESIKKEGLRLLERLDRTERRARRIGLDASGTPYTSEAFARALDRWMEAGGARVIFVLGGEQGLWQGVVTRLDEALSLSPMTLTHEMARLVLAEQVYRAATILKGTGYHR